MQLATQSILIPPTTTNKLVSVAYNPMRNAPLEDLLLEELAGARYRPGVQVAGDTLSKQYAAAEKPFEEVLARSHEELSSSKDSLALLREQAGARWLRGDAVADYEAPPGAVTARFWRLRGKPVIKHFYVGSSSSRIRFEEHLFLPPVRPTAPRSSLLVRYWNNSVDVSVNHFGFSCNRRSEDHIDLLERAANTFGSLPKMHEAYAQDLRERLPPPASSKPDDLRVFAKNIRLYVDERVDTLKYLRIS